MRKLKSHTSRILYILFMVFMSGTSFAQYAPPAGHFGTTAIHADSIVFVDWANTCVIERGYADISNYELGFASYGDDISGVGKANNVVVSLGDGGVATLTFSTPISDGDGWDFAVFENSFLDDFLELAFVEVSSNGIDYHRFNSISLTQQDTQVATFGLVDATKIYNLAGKYKVRFGTPFNLYEMKDISGLDISNIISVRIIDVVGSINGDYATFDSNGNIINEPWPTPFESSGFDLDAVGVINNRNNTSVNETDKNIGSVIFPNPAHEYFNILSHNKLEKIIIYDLNGSYKSEIINPNNKHININFLPTGFYIVKIYTDINILTTKLIKN
ncbi:MAG: T9SS type A sorting domain-containing protein [Bacteroidota bacterium]